MKPIPISDDCYIKHYNKNKNKYEITFSFYNNNIPLVTSIIKTKILLGATITDNYKTLILDATTITKLPDFLQQYNTNNNNNNTIPTQLICKLIYDLSLQLNYLINNFNKCFIGYSFKNVLVIDDTIFVYIPNNEDICDITDKNILITYPFSQNDFFQSPETLELNSIPSYIHYKTIYYSLACLILDLLKKEDSENTNTTKDYTYTEKTNYIEKKEQLLNQLTTIKDSKLYYFLKRCLTKEAEKRSLLYI
jgi:hypothetical protein